MKVKVNDQFVFEVATDQRRLKVGAEELEIDIAALTGNHAHILYQNKSYKIEMVAEDRAEKVSLIKVNGTLYHVAMEDQYDVLLKQLGIEGTKNNKVLEIKAPMPGMVLNIIVEEGQALQKGDNLLVLEAMKMENIIKSPSAGTVKRILVKKGDKVEKNEIMIQFS